MLSGGCGLLRSAMRKGGKTPANRLQESRIVVPRVPLEERKHAGCARGDAFNGYRMQAGRYIVPSRGDCLPRSPSLCICYHTDAFDVDDNRRNGKHKVMQALAAQSREFEEYARGQRRNGGSFEGAKKVRRGWIAPIKLNNALLDLWSTDLSPLRPTMAGFKEEHGASLITAIRRPADTMRRRPKNSREQAGTSGKGVPQAECRRPCEPISNLSSPLSLAVNDPRARPLPPSGKRTGRRRPAKAR